MGTLALLAGVSYNGINAATIRDEIEPERRRLVASIEADGVITPQIRRRLKAWYKKLEESRTP